VEIQTDAAPVKNLLGNERGAALLTALMIMVLMLIVGLAASRTTDTELLVARNEKEIAMEFYDAEAGLSQAMETTGSWMSDAFLGDEVTAEAVLEVASADAEHLATVRIQPIQNADIATATARALPLQTHTSPPPPGSGFGLNKFEVRRYSFTAEKGVTRLQAGVWKIFNR